MRRTASAIRLALWFPLAVVVSGLPITAGLGHRDTEVYSARVGTRRVGHSTAAAVPCRSAVRHCRPTLDVLLLSNVARE